MKCILAVLLVGAGQFATAQFNGKLTYEVDQTNKLTMTYYQSGTLGRMDAVSVPLNKGVPDLANPHYQDTILWDFGAAHETHLQYKTGRAYIMRYIAVKQAQAMQKMNTVETVQTLGQDTVNGYTCTHYKLTNTMGHYNNVREVWITQSLGTPTVQVMGSYLYYVPGFPMADKLRAAGGTGVVVRTSLTAGGITSVCNLVGVDSKTPPPAVFKVPSQYLVIDESNM